MEELELKHLAPYLPYGLKGLIQKKNVTWLSEGGIITMNTDFLNLFLPPSLYVKPILRPLSDLGTLGKEDIPINDHTINTLLVDKFNFDYGVFCVYKGEIDFELDGDSDLRYDSNKSISFNVFEFVRSELLKGHYDVFGLIEKGLAIDINTINNK